MSEINIDESMVGWGCRTRGGDEGRITGVTSDLNDIYPVKVMMPDGLRAWAVTRQGAYLYYGPESPYDIVEVWPRVEPSSPAPATQTQVSGDHYTRCAIQPIEYIEANGLGYHEGNVIKYITRHGSKGGVDDLRKAKHYIDMLIEFKYGEGGA